MTPDLFEVAFAVFGEEGCKARLFQKRALALRRLELGHVPVVYRIIIPRLVLSVPLVLRHLLDRRS